MVGKTLSNIKVSIAYFSLLAVGLTQVAILSVILLMVHGVTKCAEGFRFITSYPNR